MNSVANDVEKQFNNNKNVVYKNLNEYKWDIDINTKNIRDIFPDNIKTPVVLRDFYKNTPAYKFWNKNTIGKYFGNVKFGIELYPTLERYCTADKEVDGNYTSTFSNYIKYLQLNKKSPFYYLAEIDLLDKMDDNELPERFDEYIRNDNIIPLNPTILGENLFVGNSASSGCHMHIADNYILNQVFGKKTIWLFEYDDSNHMITKHCDSLNKLFGITKCENVNFINENFFELDHSKFNNLYKVTLNPGDSLIIPPHWWHATHGHDINCSVTTVVSRQDISYLYNPHIRLYFILIYFLHWTEYLDIENKEEIFLFYLYWFIIIICLYFYFGRNK
jgi:hypothetical protein